MRLIVPRTVTAVGDASSRSLPLKQLRSVPAYVLLGDPGAGKTTAFEQESNADQTNGVLVTARRFIGRGSHRHPEWRGKTLFIDGLDEVRAGSRDARKPIDDVLGRLERLGHPAFRLSCRSADWLGRNDLKEIVATAGYEKVKILRLDPLREDDIRRILPHLKVADPDAFIAEARDRGLLGWLGNPHLLELLAKAASASRDGDWPTGRLATFDKACDLSVREYNDEHRAAYHNADPTSAERILSAAGHLSALLLLSDTESVCQEEADEDGAFSLGDVRGAEDAAYGRALRRALKSPLFADHPYQGRFPVHRQIAEFLGGRYLAEHIGPNLPASRVLALMEGFDGVVVPHLRGLAAWLAALSPETRPRLIETDPVGVALHGDAGAFKAREREQLLASVEEHTRELPAWYWSRATLASVVDQHTVRTLATHLSDTDRSKRRQSVVYLLLMALHDVLETAPEEIRAEDVIRDGSWRREVRIIALRLLLRRGSDRPQRTTALLRLLDDVWHGRVEDRGRDLLGLLLMHLYPAHISPSDIWRYFLPENLLSGVHYGSFWSRELIPKTGDRVPELLEALLARSPAWLCDNSPVVGRDVVHQLVQRALEVGGDDQAATKVFAWLEALNVYALAAERPSDTISQIRSWFAKRPGTQKELMIEGLRKYDGRDDFNYRARIVHQMVFGPDFPSDSRAWCLEAAIETADTHPDAARQLLRWSAPWPETASDSGPSLSRVRAATAELPLLRDEVERIECPPSQPETLGQLQEEQAEFTRQREEEEEEFLAFLRERIELLRQGKCEPGPLHYIAEAYHDFFQEHDDATPASRVEERLGNDLKLTAAALSGLRNILDREDLPDLKHLLRLDEDDKISLFALPILAGLDLLGSNALLDHSTEDIVRAAGLYYLTPINPNQLDQPAWYDEARQSYPDLVADALVKVTRSRIRAKKHCHYLWRLQRDEAYRHITRIAVPALCRAFPTKCTEPQVFALRELLRAAVRWEVDGLEGIVAERIAADLDVAQRAVWLSVGLIVAAEKYVPAVVSFVEGGEEARCRHLVDFLSPHDDSGWLELDCGPKELKSLIALIGSRYSPWIPGEGRFGFVDEERLQAERLIRGWARTVSARTDDESCSSLATLSNDPALEAWHELLRMNLDSQTVSRRSALFRMPSLAQVQETLASGHPASAADLAALVVAALEEIAEHIRHGNTDGWRQFWDETRDSDGPRPMHEDRCRDRLLDALGQKLPPSVDAGPEGHYAEDKRADIRVSYGGFAIPVEIKKNRHREVWTAARTQLAKKYARDPDADGYGVYLVLWLGRQGGRVPPSGRPPGTAAAFAARLREEVGAELGTRIATVVVDASRPPGR